MALITGAAKRIGRSIALRLAAEGAAVVVNYATSEDAAEALVEEIMSSGIAARAIRADVTKRAEVQKMFATVESELGRLDILVNNTGTFFEAKFEDLTDEQWDGIMNTNLKSQFLCAQAAAPLMKRQGSGRIVNLSSLGGMLRMALLHALLRLKGWSHHAHALPRARARPGNPGEQCGARHDPVSGEPPDEDYIRRVPLHRTGKGDDIAAAVA